MSVLLRAGLIAALLMMSLYAPGTMPNIARNGDAIVVLCTGDGPIKMTLAADGSYRAAPPTSDHPDDTRHGCIWASQAQPVWLEAGADMPVVTPAIFAAQGFTEIGLLVPGAPILASLARGPPVVAPWFAA